MRKALEKAGVEFTNGKRPRVKVGNVMTVCDQCQQPLIEIDRYGGRWIGCVICNRWGKPGDKKLVMELSEEDLAALKNLLRR
jgi:hypothetical protein